MAGRGGRSIPITVPVLLLALGFPALAEVLRVPTDYPTIKSAVSRATDGDTVVVEDGIYLEKNIEITKRIAVRSKNLFGAAIYGSWRSPDAIFRVKAEARIEGFILKGGAIGIEQRDSPDVRWAAEDLVILDCDVGLSVNDAAANVGSAEIRRVVVANTRAGASTGVDTNDARDVRVSQCLIAGCKYAFAGFNHLSFLVRDSAVLDCPIPFYEATGYRPVPPATSRIEAGDDVIVSGSAALKDPRELEDFRAFMWRCFPDPGSEAGREGARERGAARRALRALVEARAFAAAGEHGAAAERYEAARTAGMAAGNQEIAWLALWGAALNERSRKGHDEAMRLCREAIDHLESWVPQVPAGVYSDSFLEDKAPVYETLVGLLLDRHGQSPGAGYDREAFFVAERAKTLARLFPPRAGGRTPNEVAAGRAAERAAGLKIAAAQLRLQEPDLSGPEKERRISELEGAEDELHAALIQEERTAAATHGSKKGQLRGSGFSPMDYARVREKLGGRGLLSYVLGQERSFVFLVTEGGLRWAELPSAEEIEAKVRAYLRFLQLEEGRGFRGAKAGAVLYDLLLAPILAGTGAPPRLIIVPDGRLFYLPFETLIQAGTEGRNPPGTGGSKGSAGGPAFLATAAEISYASSATQALGGDPWETPGGPLSTLLAVGDSGGIRCDNRSRRLKHFFFPLPHLKREIERLVDAYPWRRATVLIDGEAGEGGFKSALGAASDVVHIATHGVIDDIDWWRSALLLRPEPESGEDGFLTALEIAGLAIRARLVVLSGCGTGAGPLFEGGGIKGLSGAFLESGADHVMVSLWGVDDRTTAVFMGMFYRFLAAGDAPARALARTKRETIRSGLRNPFYWAPFVLIGRAD